MFFGVGIFLSRRKVEKQCIYDGFEGVQVVGISSRRNLRSYKGRETEHDFDVLLLFSDAFLVKFGGCSRQ